MATTRTPLQPAPTLRACHSVGFDAYIVLYREGQEDLARESIARFARNPELAFTMVDAAVMGEQIPYEPEPEPATDCPCPACRNGHNAELIAELQANLRADKRLIGTVLAILAVAVWWGSR